MVKHARPAEGRQINNISIQIKRILFVSRLDAGMQCVSESDVPRFRKKRYAVRLKPKHNNTEKSMASKPVTTSIMIILTRLQSKSAAHPVYEATQVPYTYHVSSCVNRIYHI